MTDRGKDEHEARNRATVELLRRELESIKKERVQADKRAILAHFYTVRYMLQTLHGGRMTPKARAISYLLRAAVRIYKLDCGRCGSGGITHIVESDVLFEYACAKCAKEAEKLHLKVIPIETCAGM